MMMSHLYFRNDDDEKDDDDVVVVDRFEVWYLILIIHVFGCNLLHVNLSFFYPSFSSSSYLLSLFSFSGVHLTRMNRGHPLSFCAYYDDAAVCAAARFFAFESVSEKKMISRRRRTTSKES